MFIKILIPIRWLFLILAYFDGICCFFSKKILAFFFKPMYHLAGTCKKDGTCCTKIAIYLSDSFWVYPLLRKIAIFWYQFVYNFSYTGDQTRYKIILFSCNYLQNNKCSIYKLRPFICRAYPELSFFKKPIFLKNCGFKAIKRK